MTLIIINPLHSRVAHRTFDYILVLKRRKRTFPSFSFLIVINFQDLGGRKTSGPNTVLVLATTAGAVVFIAVLGILLIWFRRRMRS